MSWSDLERARCILRSNNVGDPACWAVVEGALPCRWCKTPEPKALQPKPSQRPFWKLPLFFGGKDAG